MATQGMLPLVLLVALSVAWDWRILGPGRSRWPGRVVPGIVLPLLIPFTVPVEWVYPRAIVTVFAVLLAVKAHALDRRRISDPAMLENLGLFCFWLLVPPCSRRPQGYDEIDANRSAGRQRLLRAALKLPFAALLTALHLTWDPLHADPWLEAFWALWLTYFGVTALVDVVTGLAMQTGLHVAESFDIPPLARSPRDFWGQRWNLIVNDLAFRLIFLPLRGLRRPLRATLIVFIASGLVHEYFVATTLGRWSSYTGWMMAFFLLHGFAVMGQLWWDRGRGRHKAMARPLAVALHLAWFTATAPLFFTPIGEIFRDAWPN